MNRVLLLVLFVALVCLPVFAEEGEEEVPKVPKFNAAIAGISFTIPEGVTVEGETIPVKFTLDGVSVVGDFKIIPGDFNSLRDLVTSEMKKDGWEYKSVVSEISKGCEVFRFMYERNKKECQLLVYPNPQGGHRFFFFRAEGTGVDPVINQYLESLFLTVEIADVLKNDPPKPFEITDEKLGISFSAPWFWRMVPASGDVKYYYNAYFVNGYYNHVTISAYLDKGIKLEEAVEKAKAEMAKQTQYVAIGNSPRKVGELEATELEYTWTPKDTKTDLRERRLLVVRNKDLFEIRFTTNMLGYRAGLEDYLAFMKTIKIDPREEDKPEEEPKGDDDTPEREPKVE